MRKKKNDDNTCNCVILNKIHLSSFTANLQSLFPRLFSAFYHFVVLLLSKQIYEAMLIRELDC